ncbi:MAG TPA: hypothetical protein V6D17_00525 [Candidatus Obscuribacterales bacterium]
MILENVETTRYTGAFTTQKRGRVLQHSFAIVVCLCISALLSGFRMERVSPELYRGRDPKDHMLAEIKARGVKTIVSLRTNPQRSKAKKAEALGINFIQIPIGIYRLIFWILNDFQKSLYALVMTMTSVTLPAAVERTEVLHPTTVVEKSVVLERQPECVKETTVIEKPVIIERNEKTVERIVERQVVPKTVVK